MIAQIHYKKIEHVVTWFINAGWETITLRSKYIGEVSPLFSLKVPTLTAWMSCSFRIKLSRLALSMST